MHRNDITNVCVSQQTYYMMVILMLYMLDPTTFNVG